MNHTQEQDERVTFHKAASNDDITRLKWFLDNGRQYVNATDLCGRTALYCAIQAGHLNATRFLLDNNADMSIRDTRGETPLYAAFQRGKTHRDEKQNTEEIITRLIDNGVDVNVCSPNGTTSLMLAVQCDASLCMLQKILDAIENSPADMSTLNAVSERGFTAMHMAISGYKFHVLQLLLLAGSDCKVSMRGIKPVLEFAKMYEDGFGCMSKLLSDVEDEFHYKSKQRVFALGSSTSPRNKSIIQRLSPDMMNAMFGREVDQYNKLSPYEKSVHSIATKQLKICLEKEREKHIARVLHLRHHTDLHA